MKAFQQNTALKLLAALLCCAFFGVAAGTVLGTVFRLTNVKGLTLSYNKVFGDDYLSASYLNWRYKYAVLTCYQYEGQKKTLNASQQREYDKAAALLKTTNFRGRILDLEGNILWYNWMGTGEMNDRVTNRYYIAVEVQRNTPDEYYLVDTNSKSDGNIDSVLDNYIYDEEEDAWFADYTWEEDDWFTDGYSAWEGDDESDTAFASVASTDSDVSDEEDYRCELVAIMEWGILDGTPMDDDLHQLEQEYTSFKADLPLYIGVFIACALGWLLCLVLLLYGTGHKKDVEGIYLAPGHKCPADLLLALGMGVIFLGGFSGRALIQSLYDAVWLSAQGLNIMPLFGGYFAAAMLVALFFFTTVTAQLKAHQFLKRTLCYRVCRFCWRISKWFCSRLLQLLRAIHLFWKAVLGYCVFIVLFAFLSFQMFYSWNGTMYFILALLVGVLGLVLIVWWLLGWRKAQLAAQKLAQGDLRYQTDSSGTPWDLKNHIENLNAISGGMQKAVQEQMKSDRFRTELITNVSHDLKTPLTSIISYVDLLKKLEVQNPTEREYIDVLDRKSQRLKTLTEDLVEASKAATGVLAVNTERLEAGQLIHQALGEYEARLANAELTVITSIPEEPVYINADGRHLWRILDNLLGNCAKYAMPGTRVYVTLEPVNHIACISVKNISAEPLNIPADELMERFVRGDSSRTNEGSGLGLSIAQSLATIQGATFNVSVDGDLFKAEVKFDMINEQQYISE